MLMEDAPYDLWLGLFTESMQQEFGGDRRLKVADIGCGTGTLSIRLMELGHQVCAVDLSEDMLVRAQAKLNRPTPFLRFLQQDMRHLRLPEAVDCAVSFCDSLNYLREETDLLAAFQSIRSQLKPDGVFLFDMHTPYHLEQELGQETFYDIREDIAYIWQSRFDGRRCEVEYDVTFFAKTEADVYRRFQETHWQRAYPREVIEGLLRQAGFEKVTCGADFHWNEPGEGAKRYFFKAKIR